MTTPVESALRVGGSIGAAVMKPALRRIERLAGDVVERLTASPLAARAVHGALQGPLVEALAGDLVRYRVADRLLSEGLVEQTTERVLEGEELDHVVRAVLESDDLWLIVDEVARSPAVTAAIAQQSVSFADQVAGGVRARSRSADAWLERGARRAFRRRPAPPPAPGAG